MAPFIGQSGLGRTSMPDEPTFRTWYVPLPADLWAQAAYLTMRPTVVREQASAMLVRVARMMAQLVDDRDTDPEDFGSLPTEKQAWILGLVRHVLMRFGAPSR